MNVENTFIAIDTCISLLKSGKQIQIKMNGTSMFPFIKNDEVCIIEPITDYSKLKKGDIILFGNTNKLIAHRIKRKIIIDNKYWFTCKGDSKLNYDSPISTERIFGKVRSIIRKNIEFEIKNNFKTRFIARISILFFPFYYLSWKIFK